MSSSNAAKTAVFLGVIVGITWFLSKVFSFFGLPATVSAIIIGSFAGMGYAISYNVFEAFLKDSWELKKDMKNIERQMKMQMHESQRQQQLAMMQQRMETQMSTQLTAQQTRIAGYGVLPVKQPAEQAPPPPPPIGAPADIPHVPIPGDADYTIGMNPYS